MTNLIGMGFILFTAHLIGDFFLQTKWMAMNKSSSWKPLTVHITVYTSVLLTMLLLFGTTIFNLNPITCFIYAFANGCLHWCTDYITSRMSKKAYADGNIDKFWRIIGTDQFIHQCCLFGTLSILN